MNLSMSYIARQISYNLKLHTLYFNFNTKISADETDETDGKYKKDAISSYEYTKVVYLEKEIIKDEYRKASMPTEDGFKYKLEILKGQLIKNEKFKIKCSPNDLIPISVDGEKSTFSIKQNNKIVNAFKNLPSRRFHYFNLL